MDHISIQAADDYDFKLSDVLINKITYPKAWFAPIKLSPFFMTIEQETIQWMEALHLIRGEQEMRQVYDMEPRHFAGYTHSMANYEHGLLYSKYITMWLLWDDQCVETSNCFDEVKEPLLALAGCEPQGREKDPYVRAFRMIGDGYESLGASKAWRRRFSEKMQEWLKYAIQEEYVRSNKLSFDLGRALNLRSFTVGIRPNTLPLERAVGIELPDEIVYDAEYETLVDHAAKICCIVNDIASVPKDIVNEQVESNLILSHMHNQDICLTEAFSHLIDIHDDSVSQFDVLAHRLLKRVNKAFRERLDVFFMHLRYMDSGFGFWHQDCKRYQSLIAGAEGKAYKLTICEGL